jgi:predicted AlkP superfamily pyrophosphatase or phosphodiesterase
MYMQSKLTVTLEDLQHVNNEYSELKKNMCVSRTTTLANVYTKQEQPHWLMFTLNKNNNIG